MGNLQASSMLLQKANLHPTYVLGNRSEQKQWVDTVLDINKNTDGDIDACI